MKEIGTLTEFLAWLRVTASAIGPSISVSPAIAEDLDSMIEQFGRKGTWVSNISVAEFSSEVHAGITFMKAEISFALMAFMLSMVTCGAKSEQYKRLRVAYPTALSSLLSIVGEHDAILFLDCGGWIQCSSSNSFEERHRVRVGFEIIDYVEEDRAEIARLFGNLYVIDRNFDDMTFEDPSR
jgi:hypothetical protein